MTATQTAEIALGPQDRPGPPERNGFGHGATAALARVRLGDIGALPIVVGLVLVWGIFQALNSAFLSPANLVDLATEIVAVGVIAVGVVITLLVAQIDLSVGSMSGVASSILGVGLAHEGWSLPEAMAIALAAGLVVGVIYGVVFVRFEVPSFVITLAGLLVLLGLQLRILGATGSVSLPFNSGIVGFMQRDFVAPSISYILAAGYAAVYLGYHLGHARRRRAHHVAPRSLGLIVAKAGLLLAGLEFAFWYLNRNRGVSLPFVLFVGLVVIVDFALTRTHWGRGIYAVGGSAEAARRAGLKVNRIYISAFVITSVLAALGGLLSAGRISAASISSGTGDVNLDAIAAAVIGGTSLFGGRGKAYSALLGIVVIESIANGLTLLNLSADTRFMITGLVLLIAVVVDALARRRRTRRGIA